MHYLMFEWSSTDKNISRVEQFKFPVGNSVSELSKNLPTLVLSWAFSVCWDGLEPHVTHKRIKWIEKMNELINMEPSPINT